MRTQEEIIARINKLSLKDHLGFERASLLEYLDFDHAKEYLREGVTQAQWDGVRPELDVQLIRERILKCLPSAWEKANQCRQLAVTSAVSYFKTWLWLLEKDEVAEMMFPLVWIGKYQLMILSRYVGFSDDGKYDDNIWRKHPLDQGIPFVKALALISVYRTAKSYLPSAPS